MISEELKSQIMGVIGKHLEMDRCMVVLFGSEALGKATKRSDIDIGVDCVEPISDSIFLEMERALNEEVDTLKKIDLVELSGLDEDFLLFALKGAVIWHVGRDYLRSWIKRKEPMKS